MARYSFRFITLAFTVLATAAFGQTATETILHNFGRLRGAEPNSAPVFDAAGNLYGTTSYGGERYEGSVYRLNSAGSYSVLHRFTGASSGHFPTGVVTDAAGTLYGAVLDGGTYDFGYVYKLDPTGNLSVLYNFSGVPDGANPNSPLVRDAAGNLYGTTSGGGINSSCSVGCGTVFKVDPAGNETVLYRFPGDSSGAVPLGVTRDGAGNVYGVTGGGGANQGGVLFKIDPGGSETVLHNFTVNGGNDDGRQPNGGLLLSGGGVYGTTVYGGRNDLGVVFRFDSANHFSVIYNFEGGNNAAYPVSGLVADAAGNIYGTAAGGGNGPCGGGCGEVYKIEPNGNETVLHSFNLPDGWEPIGIVPDPAGDLYGATQIGGAYDGGAVFKLDPAGEEKLLYSFSNGEFGYYPAAGVILDGGGKLYGTAGGGVIGGFGVVYAASVGGDYNVLYAFEGQGDGSGPNGVITDSVGNLYGTTYSGGISENGVVFRVDPSGNEKVLYSFSGSGDGAGPKVGLARDAAGNLFGVTTAGGMTGPCVVNSCGVVFQLTPDGMETVLHNFTGGADGVDPSSALVLDAQGNLYGTAFEGGAFNQGLIYKIDTAGNYRTVYDFQGGAKGGNPSGTFVRDAAGNIYGPAGGGDFTGACSNTLPYGCGIVYKLDTSGNLTVLHTFAGGTDGTTPLNVVLDSAGNLYGNTDEGGIGDATYGSGLVFKVDTGGNYSVVYDFNCDADTGCFPEGALVLDRAGDIYGTTYQGGERETGIIYRLTP